jgi:subtilisin family serine protease
MMGKLKKLQMTVVAAMLGAAATLPVIGQQASGAPDVAALALAAPVAAGKIDSSLRNSGGEVEVVVRLAGAPLAVANGPNSRRLGGTMSRAQQSEHSAKLRESQSAAMARIAALGGTELARVRIAYNALIVRVGASALDAIAALPEVQSIRPVGQYELQLGETVPYIGAAAAQAGGSDGSGVKVAVLDSGIDYTHFNLGGPGTAAAYAAAYGTATTDPRNKTTDGLFPTAGNLMAVILADMARGFG